MTNDKEKEDLKKEFHKWYFDSEGEPDKELLDAHIKWLDEVFEFFYSEIEARESIIQAADDVLETSGALSTSTLCNLSDVVNLYERACKKYISLRKRAT